VYLVALTGGIAAGKSTVAELWATLGATHIDADTLAREAVAIGSKGLKAVTDAFGSQVLGEDGSLNRAQLASVVFADETKRRQLEGIVHPIVRELALKAIQDAPSDAVVVYSIPLLAETSGRHLDFDLVVTVEAPRDRQIQRLVESRSFSRADAEARIDSQAMPAVRANLADHILNSNQDLSLLLADARKLWAQIEKLAAAKSSASGDGGAK